MIAVATTDEGAMVAALREDNILTSPRDGNVRLSFHCYNSEEDVERVIAGLEKHSDLLAR
jgi:selenocysteine lyase/cysteine desulfurase